MDSLRRRFHSFRGTLFLLDLRVEEHSFMSFYKNRFAKMITGVAVVTVTLAMGTSAFAVERSLAGVTLGSKASLVLQKYGNPTRISVGTVSATVSVPNQPSTQPAPGANPYLQPMKVEGLGDAYNPFATGPYGIPPAGGLPPIGGMNAPGSMPGGGMPQPGQPQQQIVTQQEVTWTYEFTKGTASGDTVEFIVSEGGLITQITVGGATSWSLSKTSKGVKLGADYKYVLLKYGYPEGHAYVGKFLRVSYVDKHRVMFTFLNRKVVGITIALPD